MFILSSMNFRAAKLKGILTNKCPRCREGSVFESGNPYRLRNFASMHRSCPKCSMDYRQEPGFYFGATYVSYLMQVVIVLSFYLVLYIGLDWGIWPFAGLSAGTLLLLLPLTFRLSRLTWLTLFGDKNRNYRPKN